MRYRELIENTDSDDDLFGKSLVDRIRARLAELEDDDMMEPDDMIDTVAEEFNLEVEQVYDLLDDEVYENTDDDDDLFGGRDRDSPTPERAMAKFKMFFPAVKRVSWSRMNFRTIDELFGFSNDNRFHAGESHSRHSYWSTQAYTNRETGLGLLIYEDSGAGTWAYIGAQDRASLAEMIQQLIAAGQLEDPEAAKQRRLAKQQARAATVEKKGIRVGTRIDIGGGSTAEVVEIKPTTGKVRMKDITGPYIGHEREYSVYQISKRMIMSETDDNELFGVITRVWEFQGDEQEMDSNADYIKDRAEDLGLQFLGRHEYENWVVAYEFKGREQALKQLDRILSNSLGDGYGGAEPVELNEMDSDDDMFATPEVRFSDVFNEYDEDELINRGFEYGDDPKSDINILNGYLEGYKNFRVIGIKGGEHDLVLQLDHSSRLNETDDDEMFGSPSFNAEQAGKLIASTGATSGELVDPESIQNALEHAANRVLNPRSVQMKAAEQLKQWMAIDDDTQWELVDQIVNVVYDINGDGWEPEDTIYNESDDELFGKKWQERINMSSIELDGIDTSDSPDFSDAHVSYAEFDDGTPLNNEQLEWLTNELGSTGELHELVWDSLHEDGHAL